MIITALNTVLLVFIAAVAPAQFDAIKSECKLFKYQDNPLTEIFPCVIRQSAGKVQVWSKNWNSEFLAVELAKALDRINPYPLSSRRLVNHNSFVINRGLTESPPNVRQSILQNDLPNRSNLLLKQIIGPINSAINESKNPSRDYDRHGAWTWSYSARTALLGYKIFKDKRFLLPVLKGSVYYSNLPSWDTYNQKTGNSFREVSTIGAIAIPIVELLLLAKSDSSVNEVVMPAHEKLLLNAVIARLSEFKNSYKENQNYAFFTSPLHENRIEATNHMALYATAIGKLYELTNDDKLAIRLRKLYQFWVNSTSLNKDGRFVWGYEFHPPSYYPKPNSPHKNSDAEIFWKASITIELPVAAYNAGLVKDTEYLKAVRSVFTSNLMKDGKLKKNILRIDGIPDKEGKLDIVKNQIPSLASWHLLNCAVIPIPNMNKIIFAETMEKSQKINARAFYYLMYGAYSIETNCGEC